MKIQPTSADTWRIGVRQLRAVILGTVLVATTGTAKAETPVPGRNSVAAEALFNAGKTLLEAGDWANACSKFEKSMLLEVAVSTLIKIARCHEREGKLATAWYDYQRALKLNRELPATDRRRRELASVVAATLAALEPRIPRLRITLSATPEGTTLKRDGELLPLEVLGEVLPIDAGEHELIVAAPGHIAERRVISAAEGRIAEIQLTLASEKVPSASSTSAPPQIHFPPSQSVERERPTPTPLVPHANSARETSTSAGAAPQQIVGLALGGLGLASLAVAGYFGIRTLSLVRDSDGHCNANNECDPDGMALRDDAASMQTTGLVLAGAGAAMLGSGLLLHFSVPSKRGASSRALPSVAIAPRGVAGCLQW
ncbi:MAG TPA: hypothetical protein VK524_20705 [Polyangiaceae bacterium]|nr:hypothetical protein [Polyangiaceae bacterium]